MKDLNILLFTFVLIINAGCMDNQQNQAQSGPLSYDQAIELAKQYLRDEGYYKDNETVYWYEPKCSFWFISNPDTLAEASKAYGLTNKNYYAIDFVGETVFSTRENDAIVFIDKDGKRVIGVLYDHGRFVENKI